MLADKSGENVAPKATSQKIFKWVNIVLAGFLLYCIPGFLSFREVLGAKGYYIFTVQSWWWCLAGFVCYGVIKYTYFWMVQERVLNIIHDKYQGDERQYRVKAVCKLSFDTIFYSISAFANYHLFKEQYWFPRQLGGSGECGDIYRTYPDWPSNEIFYMLQLGVHSFAVFESLAIKRQSDRKYYEFLLHHFMATTLILFSLLTNMVAVGAVILFLHDFSDVTAAFARGFVETKYENFFVYFVLFVVSAVNWFYMRAVVYPFCIIKEVYESLPGEGDSWRPIRVQHMFLMLLCSILVFMHLFWFFFLMQTGLEMAMGKPKRNSHDDKVRKQ